MSHSLRLADPSSSLVLGPRRYSKDRSKQPSGIPQLPVEDRRFSAPSPLAPGEVGRRQSACASRAACTRRSKGRFAERAGSQRGPCRNPAMSRPSGPRYNLDFLWDSHLEQPWPAPKRLKAVSGATGTSEKLGLGASESSTRPMMRQENVTVAGYF